MKAPAFNYHKVESLEKAFELFDQYGEEAKIIAGGQSLVAAMNLRMAAPEALIDINGIQELSDVSVVEGNLRIGALVRHVEIGTSEIVSTHAPLLQAAVPHIAHAGIRNRGTFGGSLVNADPASEFPACVVALGGKVNLASREGQRSVEAEDFFLGIYDTATEPDEVLVSVDIPAHADDCISAIKELARRSGDYATAGLVAHGKFAGGICSDMRLVFFGVSDKPVNAKQAAQALIGKSIEEDSIAAAQAAIDDDLEPLADLHTAADIKAHLAGVLCGRVLREMAGI